MITSDSTDVILGGNAFDNMGDEVIRADQIHLRDSAYNSRANIWFDALVASGAW